MFENNLLNTFPRISVVMAIYKEPVMWMRLAIDSIINQTFEDFEFIIINDNPSRIENRNLLEEYSAKDSRIVPIQNKVNIGLTKSLNKGLSLAKGEFIARMDADDISMPERFEKQLEYLNNNLDVGAVGCNAYVINNNNEITGEINRPCKKDDLRYLSIFESPIYHPASFFRRKISNEFVAYDETIKYSQDYALWIKLLRKCSIANLSERLLQYRITDSQISTAHHVEQQQFAFENQMTAISNMGILMEDEDIECFKHLTRPAASEIFIESRVLGDFIVKFLKGNKNVLSDGYNVVKNRLILIYANSIAKHLSLPHAFFMLLKLQLSLYTLNIYSILSLVNKYRIRKS